MFLSEIELVGEALEGARLFHGIQIFALKVFDQCHLKRELLGNLANNHGNASERRALGGAPAAFAGDQLVAKTDPPDDKGLDDSTRADRASQFLKRLLAKARARLIGAGIDEIDIDLEQDVIRGLVRGLGWGYCRCCSRRPRHRLLLRRLLGVWLRFADQGAQSPSQGVSGHWR